MNAYIAFYAIVKFFFISYILIIPTYLTHIELIYKTFKTCFKIRKHGYMNDNKNTKSTLVDIGFNI